MKSINKIFTKDVIKHLKDNKDLITSDLLEEIRSFGNEGKHLAIEILDIHKDEEQYYLDAFGNRVSQNGNRQLKKPFTKLPISKIHEEEIRKCAEDIHYFRENYIKIVTPKGINFPDLREYQKGFIDEIIVDEHESIVSLQPRQSGKSVTVAIYLAHLFIFESDKNIGIAANKSSMAKEFLDKTKKILLEIPIWMQVGISVWNKTFIEGESGMRILTDATSGDSFRGFTCSVVVVDECVHGDETVTIRNKSTGVIEEMRISDLFKVIVKDNTSVDRYITTDFEVMTSNGFKQFEGIKRTLHSESLKLLFNDGSSINVSKNHDFFEDNTFICAKDLKEKDTISNKVISHIEEKHDTEYFYDLLEVHDGHHYTTSGVESSNCAFIRPSLWEEFADSIFPSQSGLAWKKNILISTANGLNFFYEFIKGARSKSTKYISHDELDSISLDGRLVSIQEYLEERKAEIQEYNITDDGSYEITFKQGNNGYVNYEVHWGDVPRYNSDGTKKAPEDFKRDIISKYGLLYWNQNYANEFVGSSATLISADALKSLSSKEPHEIRDGKLKIYHYPEKGHKYLMTVDAAKDGEDSFAIQVIDITNFSFKQVASAKLDIDYLLMPEFINEWCEYYNYPYLIIENNEGAGQSIADQMKNDYEYDNLHYDQNTDSNSSNLSKAKKKYPGFRNTPKTRRQILQTLKLFMENDRLELNDKDTINEFFTFILIKNKYQADDGCHDDMIMSLAMSFVPFLSSKNFEDMKAVVKNLYNFNEDSNDEDAGFGDMLVVGSFDDGTDENSQYTDIDNQDYLEQNYYVY